jgi:pseudaminic acid biosynthesis-associated methylase
MSTTFKTEQEAFWAGSFGDEYSKRNVGERWIAANLALFSRALGRIRPPHSCIEFGANTGLNLQALRRLFPEMEQFAVEINQTAAAELRRFLPPQNVFETSILEFEPRRTFDLVLIKGVLIHLNPQFLPSVYALLHKAATRSLLICEYYNPVPVEVTYRGHQGRLFKRDFCGELLDKFSDLGLVDYGFCYHRDTNFPQDDLNWFLLEK